MAAAAAGPPHDEPAPPTPQQRQQEAPAGPREQAATAAAAPGGAQEAAAPVEPATASSSEVRAEGTNGGAPDRPPAQAADGAAPERPVEKAAKAAKSAKGKGPKDGKQVKGQKAREGPQGEAAADLKPATASREDNLTYDLRHMAAYDIAPVPMEEAAFLAYTRDSVQLLVNKMFVLPKQTTEEGSAVELPTEVVFKLPRQKPVPKEKPKTRWEKFMEERNMRKRKRSRLVYDEAAGDWKPRWGYRSAKKGKDAGEQAIYEVRQGENPDANPFDKMKAEQKLLLARQKMREVRNKVEAAGGKMRASVPDLGGAQKRGKEGLREAIKRAQTSSGSRGKFDRIAPNEATNLQPKRQKIPEPVSGEKERERYMKFAGKVLSGETVDKDRAAKVGAQQAEGQKLGRKGKAKGVKGQPGGQRRSKQGGRKQGGGGGRQRGRKVKP